MELNKKTKVAVALVELLISLIMTSILMLMLFGIVAKKAKNEAIYQNSIFYCWKDWNGTLYQKSSSESIQQVPTCKVKIPKNAKNVQAFLIGGGAGGHKFNTTTVNNILKSSSNYSVNSDKDEEKLCINPQGDNIYTELYDSNNRKFYNIMTSCESNCNSNGCSCNIDLVYKKISDIYTKFSSGSPFSDSFIRDLFLKGYCYMPIYTRSNLNYIQSSADMADENIYYYKGSSKNGPCIGVCSNLAERFDCQVNSGGGTCYQNGKFISKNKTYEPQNGTCDKGYNKFVYKYIKSTINIGGYKEALTGDLKRGYAEAGKEYTISAESIGNGGKPGDSGGVTQFGNLKANGGVLKPISNTIVNFPVESAGISALSDLEKTKYISICSSAGLKCNGATSSQLRELASEGRIKANSSEIPVAKYESGKWNDESNPQNSTNDIESTGFGFFGASGAAVDCTIKYYPIKEFQYNCLNKTKSSAEIDSCASGGNGMGGAIIIKWD